MQVKWLGHAAFLFVSKSGVRVITDPYTVTDGIKYQEITEPADIVTVSHGHYDHNNSAAMPGKPVILTDSGTARGLEFLAVKAFHDESKGSQRGTDTIFCFSIDGIKICHLGDLGQLLSNAQLKEIGNVDVLCCPVGGYYTIDAAKASKIYEIIKPKVFIPMHFKTAGSSELPIVGAEEFTRNKKNVVDTGKTSIELEAGNLPRDSQIFVLKPALL